MSANNFVTDRKVSVLNLRNYKESVPLVIQVEINYYLNFLSLLNVVVEGTHLLCIPEVSGSILGHGNRKSLLSGSPQSFLQIPGRDGFLPCPFRFINNRMTLYDRVTRNVVINKCDWITECDNCCQTRTRVYKHVCIENCVSHRLRNTGILN